MEEIPANCILSKGTTGCGATTLATEQNTPAIIAMPYTELIRNKSVQYSENNEGRPVLLPIYGEGDKRAEIETYMHSHRDLPKIATTYDSLPKVCRILSDLGYDPYENMHLCVDEWHVMFNSYDFRNSAVRNMLDCAKGFRRVTYMSATPIEREYWLEELSGFPEYRIE